MRIEFVGLMGSGKSTTVDQLKKEYPDRYVTKKEVLTEKYYTIIKGRSSIKYYVLLILCKVKFFKNLLRIIQQKILLSSFKFNEDDLKYPFLSILDYLNISEYDHKINENISKRIDLYIIDYLMTCYLVHYNNYKILESESLLQRGLALSLYSNEIEVYYEKFLNSIPLPDVVVIVNGDKNAFKKRVIKRQRQVERLLSDYDQLYNNFTKYISFIKQKDIKVIEIDGEGNLINNVKYLDNELNDINEDSK